MLAAVVYVFGSLSYGHKRARNKRIGPGGGTLRLHQTVGKFPDYGVEIG